MNISLLVAYRNRKNHLDELIAALSDSPTKNIIELVIIEGDETPTLSAAYFDLPYVQYHFAEMGDIFHKTHLLNIGLDNASCKYIIPYDVDLIPVNNAIENTLKIAEQSSGILPTGYRLMCAQEVFNSDLSSMSVAHEDSASALQKHLSGAEKFGVCPIFNREKLIGLGGWQEKFVGWGAEDQDIIERYCGNEIQIGRFPSILYVHLHHDLTPGWNDSSLVQKNRALYKESRNRKAGV